MRLPSPGDPRLPIEQRRPEPPLRGNIRGNKSQISRPGLDDDELIGDPPGTTAHVYTEWTAVQVVRVLSRLGLVS